MNRDLQRRIRPVSGITLERPVLRADARLAARLAHLLDTRTKLWQDSSEEQEKNGDQANQPEVQFYSTTFTAIFSSWVVKSHCIYIINRASV